MKSNRIFDEKQGCNTIHSIDLSKYHELWMEKVQLLIQRFQEQHLLPLAAQLVYLETGDAHKYDEDDEVQLKVKELTNDNGIHKRFMWILPYGNELLKRK